MLVISASSLLAGAISWNKQFPLKNPYADPTFNLKTDRNIFQKVWRKKKEKRKWAIVLNYKEEIWRDVSPISKI